VSELAARRRAITARSRTVRPGDVVLLLLVWVIMAVPWLLGFASRALWWVCCAVAEGFLAGFGRPPRPG
jgi:hypothetical protein